MKKEHHKFKLSVLEVQGISQCIADNLSLPQLKQLDVRMELAKGEPSTVNGVTISINLYSGALGDLLILDQGVQLTTSRVQRKNHDKVDRDLKETVNQSNKRKGILPKAFKDINCRRTKCLKVLNRRRIRGRGEQLSIIQGLQNQ